MRTRTEATSTATSRRTARGDADLRQRTLRGFNYDGAGLTPIAALNFYPITCLQCGIIPSAGNLDTDAYDEILASSTVTAVSRPSTTMALGILVDVDGEAVPRRPGN
ncbi:MAG: hypothetical protein U0166_04495 [Acidobacteriota bacterium]